MRYVHNNFARAVLLQANADNSARLGVEEYGFGPRGNAVCLGQQCIARHTAAHEAAICVRTFLTAHWWPPLTLIHLCIHVCTCTPLLQYIICDFTISIVNDLSTHQYSVNRCQNSSQKDRCIVVRTES